MSAMISPVNSANLSGQVILANSGVAGVTVKLVNAAGTVIDTLITDSSGAYFFAGLAAGTYRVQYVAPSGKVLATGGQAAIATGLTPAVTLAAGQSLALPAETLALAPATVSGNTAILGAAYPAWGGVQSGVTVSLLNAAGTVVATTVSSATGWYVFRSVSPGAYQLKFTPVAGEIVAPSGVANATTGLTAAFTLTPGQSYTASNANFVQAAAITGSMLLLGAALPGATVGLLDKSGSVLATTTTNSTGAFTFNNLQAGAYQVQYTPPAHDALVAGGPASIFTNLTAAIALGAGQTVVLAPETVTTAAAAIVTGSVIHAGAGQSGVTVALRNAAGTVVATTTTNSTGGFNFTGVAPGSYQVQYTPPAGEALQATVSALATAAAVSVAPSITLAAGQILNLAAQTLVTIPATIDGSVRHFGATTDPTGGSGEAGVGVSLLTASGAVVATTVSNTSGAFEFTNVSPGNYKLGYSLPSGQNFESGSGVSLSTGQSAPFAAAAGATLSMPVVAVETTINTAALHLTFDDEFNSFVSSPNGSVGWMTTYPYGGESARALPANGEAEYYSDSSVGVNPFSINNGILDITATKAAPGSNPYNLPYNSGLATTFKSFAQLYGYFEVKAELPSGQGLWPAFWLLPDTVVYNSELDVFEVLGNAPATIYETTHGSATDGSYAGKTLALYGINTATAFHTYGVDWEPTTITYYIDGTAVSTLPTPATMNKPMYMLLNLAVGAQGSWPGAPNSTTQFPATMQVDYVRAYATANTVSIGGTAALGAITGNVTLAQSGQAGVTVSLQAPTGVVIATTTTGSDGSFTFNSVSAGAYQVKYTAPTNTTLQAGGPANTTTGLTSSITLAAGKTLTLATETLASAAGAVTGSVVYAGAGLAGVALALLTPAGTAVATTTTDTNGAFSFNNVTAGSYQVKYAAPADKMLQIGGPADSITGLTSSLTLTAGQTLALAAETLAPATGTVTGSVVYAGVGQSGVAMELQTTVGAVVATTTTGSTGSFSFANVAIGSYQVHYVAPAGQAPNATGPANTLTGLTSALTVTANTTLSLGTETLIPAIGRATGKIYHLGSADPSWGTAQSGVGVTLVNAAGATVATAVTAGTGYFQFSNVAAGTYHYAYTLPAGEAFQAGGPVNTVTGVSASFVLTAGSVPFTSANVVSSSNSFALNGAGAIALRSDGNYTVAGTASGGTLTLGNGNDSVNLAGGGNTITVGAGNSTITALGANNLVTVGPGMSFITVDASAGNKFVTLAAGQGLETISGFTSSDVLGLSRTLAGLTIDKDLSNLGSYVTAVTNGGNTTLLVTPNGSGSASAFAQLNGVKATVDSLISGRNISLT